MPTPGGESDAMVAQRVRAWFESLRCETAVVSHGAFGRILRGLYLRLDSVQMSELDEPQGCVFRLQMGGIARLETGKP